MISIIAKLTPGPASWECGGGGGGGGGNIKQVRARTELGILASASLVNLCTDGLVRHSVIP